nr:discoidin domain-containing protein [Armatimonadota bacterium]
MNKHHFVSLLLFFSCAAPGFAAQDELARSFADPPDSARPGVWWRWIDGNVSREGITRDLHEMAEAGIRSAEIFDVAGAPQVGKAGMMNPLWRELFHHAVDEAARNNIQLGVVPAAGWGTGGPWIGPENAAKVLRYTETQVDGARHLSQVLPSAPAVGGYYQDVATVAFREKPHRPVQPDAVTSNAVVSGYCGEENWPPADVVDGDPNTVWRSDRAPSPVNPVWLDFRYHEALTASALWVTSAKDGGPSGCELQSSEDGLLYRTVATFAMAKGEAKRVAFTATTTRFFRLSITGAYSPDVQLAEAWLLRAGDEPDLRPGIQWWWFKSANRGFWDWPTAGPAVLDQDYSGPDAADLRHTDVIDLSAQLHGGKLEWDVPPGRW